jgi:hypothetical protein
VLGTGKVPKTVSVEQNGPTEENDEKSTETTSVEKKGLEKETNSSTGKEEKETPKKSPTSDNSPRLATKQGKISENIANKGRTKTGKLENEDREYEQFLKWKATPKKMGRYFCPNRSNATLLILR